MTNTRGRGSSSSADRPESVGSAPGNLPRDDWFRVVWDGMTEDERNGVRDKARWEHVSLRAVLVDWPTLAPPGVWHLIPRPERAA